MAVPEITIDEVESLDPRPVQLIDVREPEALVLARDIVMQGPIA